MFVAGLCDQNISKKESRIHEFASAKKAAAAAQAAATAQRLQSESTTTKHPPLPLPPTPVKATAATATAAAPAPTPAPAPAPAPVPVVASKPSVAEKPTPAPAAATATETKAAAKPISSKAAKVLGGITDIKPTKLDESKVAGDEMLGARDGRTATTAAISGRTGGASVVELTAEQAAAYNKKVDAQRKRWHKFLKNHDINKPGYILPKSTELKDLVRNGIPPELRGKVWYSMSGIAAVRHKIPFTYYQNLTKKENPGAAAQIEKDLHRTFPNHVVYQNKNGAGITMLRRILHAYACRNPAVGYCQSLNFIVGLFLLFMDEEDAFWLLVHLVEDVACVGATGGGSEPGAAANTGSSASSSGGGGGGGAAIDGHISFYYQRDLAGIRIDQLVFKALVAEKLPKVGDKLTSLKVPVEPLTINWFMCMLIHTLPLEVNRRRAAVPTACTSVLWD